MISKDLTSGELQIRLIWKQSRKTWLQLHNQDDSFPLK